MVLRPLSRKTVLQASYIIIILATGIQMIHSEIYSAVLSEKKSIVATNKSIDKFCERFSIRQVDQRDFYSPGHPHSYSANTVCFTKIEVPFPNTIQLEFVGSFLIEKSLNCEYDGLVIRDGPYGFSKLIGRFCGVDVPPTITSTGQALWLKFYSDLAVQLAGFHATYTIKKQEAVRPKIEDCFPEVSGQTGKISVEDIPIKFLDYSRQWNIPLTCIWRIKVKNPSKIYVNVKIFKVADATNCDVTFVDVIGQDLISDKRIDRFCSNERFEPSIVNGKIAHVVAQLQPQNLESKLHIEWKAVPDPAEFSNSESLVSYDHNYSADSPFKLDPCINFTVRSVKQINISSPGYPDYYRRNTNCITRIEAPHSTHIELEFRDTFDIEGSFNCKYDGLLIRDGQYGFSQIKGRYCGNKPPPIIRSTGSSLWLNFYSDDSVEHFGFTAVYRFVKDKTVRPKIEECIINVKEQAGNISINSIPFKFLNYSKHWNIPLSCIWRIEIDARSKIFIDVDISDQKMNCKTNQIYVIGKDLMSDKIAGMICVDRPLEPVVVAGNIAHIIFQKLPVDVESNFVISWRAIQESARIVAGEQKAKRHFIATKSLVSYSHNFTADGPVLVDPCINFTVKNMNQRELLSPGYPSSYMKDSNCITRIEAPYPNIIELDFRDRFDIENSVNCEYDGLVIRDGPYGFSKVIARHCGTSFPPIIQSTGQSLWLQFYSDDTIENAGFKAVYRFVDREAVRPRIEDCKFDVTGYAGEIKIEDIPTKFLNYTKKWNIPLMCIWKIEVQPKWKIYIAFKEFSLVVPNSCEKNFIDIHGGDLLSDKSVEIFCSTLSEPRKVEGNVAHVTFYSEPNYLDASFNIIWTAYRNREKGEANCAADEFHCDEDTCIDQSLKCDGHENCEQQNDENRKDICETEDRFALLKKEHMIFILVLACGMIIGICFSTCLRCYRKIKAHNEIMEKLKERQSKESSIAATLDSTLAAQIAQRKSDRMRTYSEELNNEDCHVPDVGGIALNVMGNKYPNGGRSITRDDQSDIMLGSQEEIDRDPNKLSHYNFDRNKCDPPPPPPPPPRFRDWSSQYDGSNQCAIHSNRTPNAAAYKQYMAGTPEDSEIDNDSIPPAPPPPTSRPPKTARPVPTNNAPTTRSPQRFRAEAVIEMNLQDQRPRSFESTKSAPDVIVTH